MKKLLILPFILLATILFSSPVNSISFFVGFENPSDFEVGSDATVWNSPASEWVLDTYPDLRFEPTTIIKHNGLQAVNLTLSNPVSDSGRRLEIHHNWDPLTTEHVWLEGWYYIPSESIVNDWLSFHRCLYERYWGPGGSYYWANIFQVDLVIDGRSSRPTYGSAIFDIATGAGSVPDPLQSVERYPSDDWQYWNTTTDRFEWLPGYENKWMPPVGQWFKIKTYAYRNFSDWNKGIIKVWMSLPPDYTEELLYNESPIRTIGIDPALIYARQPDNAYFTSAFSLYTEIGGSKKSMFFDDIILSDTQNEPTPEPTTVVNIAGTVTDSSTALPIQGATVTCNVYSSTTNSTGGYKIEMPSTGSCNLTTSKSNYTTNITQINFPNNGTYVFNIILEPLIKLTGRLLDKNDNTIQANIIVYQQDNIISSIQTNSSGHYSLQIPNGTYDIQFNLTNFYIPNYSIKLNSVNVSKYIQDLIKYVTGNSSENKVSIVVDTNYTKTIKIYSEEEPSVVKMNETTVPSWNYDKINKILTINLSVVIANSGSAADIQAAVDQVAAMGGGTVYIPEGTFHWNGETVTIPGGVNVFGASPAGCKGHENNWEHYIATTILHNDAVQPFPDMFVIDGTGGNNKQTRISGIQFEANDPPVGSEGTGIVRAAISVREAKNFRIDHCSIINFAYRAIMIQTGATAWPNEVGHSSYGVIDHCFFDAPYKDNGGIWEVAYGVVGTGNMQPKHDNWDNSSIQKYTGKYQDFTDVALFYVEDCNFRRMRHSTDGANGAIIVTRHCLFDHIADYLTQKNNIGEVCLHPYWPSQYPPRLAEAYYNSFRNENMHRSCPIHPDQPHSMLAIIQRGGSGLYFGNDYYQPEPAPNYVSTLMRLQEESILDHALISETYIWDEEGRYTNVWPGDNNGDGLMDGFLTYTGNDINPAPELDVDFFLRQPNLAQDGWDYTPYIYPHPLTLET